MMKPRHIPALLLALLPIGLAAPEAIAQVTGDREDYRALHQALCFYDASRSLIAIQELLDSAQLSNEEAWELMSVRSQLYDYRDGISQFPAVATGCHIYGSGNFLALPIPTADSLNWQRATELVQAGAGQSGRVTGSYGIRRDYSSSTPGNVVRSGGVPISNQSPYDSAERSRNRPSIFEQDFGSGLTPYDSGRSSGGIGSSSGGGNCNNPNDIAADGSRCGGRASSVRRGGR